MTTETTETTDRTAVLERYRSGVADVEDALAGITEAELDRPQASGEWTARQIVNCSNWACELTVGPGLTD